MDSKMCWALHRRCPGNNPVKPPANPECFWTHPPHPLLQDPAAASPGAAEQGPSRAGGPRSAGGKGEGEECHGLPAAPGELSTALAVFLLPSFVPVCSELTHLLGQTVHVPEHSSPSRPSTLGGREKSVQELLAQSFYSHSAFAFLFYFLLPCFLDV